MASNIRRKYPKAMDEAIWTLRLERLGHAEIMRRIREGEAGLDRAYDIPRATYWEKLRRLRLARGDERDAVIPGDEVSTIDAIDRRILALANAELRELEAKRRARKPLSDADLRKLDRAASISARLRRTESKPRQPGSKQGAKARNDSPAVSLEMLSRQVNPAPSSSTLIDTSEAVATNEATSDDTAANGTARVGDS